MYSPLIYRSFWPWEVPVYIHCPPVMKDATHKLSKRNGDASYEDLIAKGYLKDAVLNYIALLGWSPKGEREIFTLPELVGEWDPAGISKSPAMGGSPEGPQGWSPGWSSSFYWCKGQGRTPAQCR